MGLGRLGKSITENLGLKIVSLLLAVILWLYVTAQQIDMQVFRVPIELTCWKRRHGSRPICRLL